MDKQLLRSKKHLLTGELIKAGTTFKGNSNSCCCPFHDDKHASAGVYEKEGVWRFKCQACGAGGDYYDIKSMVDNIPLAELLSDKPNKTIRPSKPKKIYHDLDKVAKGFDWPTTFYEYTNPKTGKVELAMLRIESKPKKDYRPFTPYKGGWVMEFPEKPWPLYNRTRVLNSGYVIVVEGEKCVHLLNKIGLVATTSPGGANNALSADWSILKNKTVTLWPDNDKNGLAYMDKVNDILLDQDVSAEVSMIDVSKLGLPEHGDVEQYLQGFGAASIPEMRMDIEQLCESSRGVDPATELFNYMGDIADGKIREVDWPWHHLTRHTQALLPATITVLAGPPCAAKSVMLMESMTNWVLKQKVKVSYLALEEDRKFYSRRLLAQLSEDTRVLNNEFVRKNYELCSDLVMKHDDDMKEVMACMHFPEKQIVSMAYVCEWLTNRAEKGDRVIIIDPITHASGNSDQCWVDDMKFMSVAGKVSTEYGLSVVVITHPRKGRKSAIGLDEIAGGTSYQRFSQCVLWIQDHHPPLEAEIITDCGTDYMRFNRTIKILKARNARGSGVTLGFNLCGDSLRFAEQGVIKEKEK